MKDRLKKVWEDRKRYAKPAALVGVVGVVAAIALRDTRKGSISETVADDTITIDNWVNGAGLGLTVITEPGTNYELPGWTPRST